MNEIEILVPLLSSREDILAALAGMRPAGESRLIDDYFRHPLIADFDPDENGRLRACVRVRTSNESAKLTHKTDIFNADGSWSYSDETEFSVSSADHAKGFLRAIGFVPLVTIASVKKRFLSPPYEVVYEEVEDLGRFLEVELCVHEGTPVEEEKQRIRAFIEGLGVSVGKELDVGKPELMLRSRR